MLIVIDIGNTNITMGLVDKDEIIGQLSSNKQN